MPWQPTASLRILQERSQILRKLREFFYEHDMLEVQTPVLGSDTVVDRHLDPITVPTAHTGCRMHEDGPRDMYLQTSPEFAMKRLLAAGLPRIFQIGPVFRAGERGTYHNPEFTMVEWYRAGDDFDAGVNCLVNLVKSVADVDPAEVTTYRDAFQKELGCDPLEDDLSTLSDQARAHGIEVERDWSHDTDDWLNLLFASAVQPRLGLERPVVVTHYPASQSALSKISQADPRTAERFELFFRGVELANGYHELLDADELIERNKTVNRQRQADGKSPLPAESLLADAMRSGLPSCSGCALGLDRLIMVLTSATSIDQVMPFPFERC